MHLCSISVQFLYISKGQGLQEQNLISKLTTSVQHTHGLHVPSQHAAAGAVVLVVDLAVQHRHADGLDLGTHGQVLMGLCNLQHTR